MSSSGGQTPSSRDPASRDRVQPPGLWLQVLSTSTNAQRIQAPQPPKCVKPRVSLRRVSVPFQGKEAQENPEEGKAHPNTTLAPRGNSQSFPPPFSLLPVLTLAALLQGAGSDLPEARSTCHLLLIFVCDQF